MRKNIFSNSSRVGGVILVLFSVQISHALKDMQEESNEENSHLKNLEHKLLSLNSGDKDVDVEKESNPSLLRSEAPKNLKKNLSSHSNTLTRSKRVSLVKKASSSRKLRSKRTAVNNDESKDTYSTVDVLPQSSSNTSLSENKRYPKAYQEDQNKKHLDSQEALNVNPLGKISAKYFSAVTYWMSKKVKDFSQTFFYPGLSGGKWIPQLVKNLAQNVSYRYLKGSKEVVSAALDLFKMYVSIAQKTVEDVKNVVSTGAEFAASALLGGLGSLVGSVASNAVSYAVGATNPVLLVMNVMKDLGSLNIMGKVLLYGFQMSQNTFINVLSDVGRSLFTKEKVFRNLFKSPEVYKSVVDKYVFEKFFKVLINTLIGIYGIYHLSSLYHGDYSSSYTQSFQKLAEVIKEVGGQLPKIFPELLQKKGWINKAYGMYKILFNNTIALKKFQKSILILQSALLRTLQEMVALGSKHWSKGGYESVKLFDVWLQSTISGVSTALNVQSGKVGMEIAVNEAVRDTPRVLGNAAVRGIEWGKSWF
ncbi:hypothetical protein [Holospora curviuscula]|nr:hypothetical protein [Holospora curviuscula]